MKTYYALKGYYDFCETYGPERQQHHLQHHGSESAKGGKKGKPRQGLDSGVAPRGMKGCVGRDPKGRNLCFDYNLSSCANAPDGEHVSKSPKGRCACFKAGCYKVHQFCQAHPEDMPKKSDAE